LAVDLSINPNTVIRAYREMEIEGLLETHQGSGTFVRNHKFEIDELERFLVENEIVRSRGVGQGILTSEDAIKFSAAG
jgi:GntR family transcriptional regulator